MNYRQAKIVLRASIFLILFICAGCIVRCSRTETPAADNTSEITTATNSVSQQKQAVKQAIKKSEEVQRLKVSSKVRNYAQQFNDLNDAHIQYATRIGIKPISSTRDIWRLTTPLVEVKPTEEYTLDRLTHSYPYLVEPAERLLKEIGKRFREKIESQGGGKYKLKVTSLLRTRESVNRLQKGNVNSTDNSAHLYGSTFDISYVDFPEESMNTKKHSDMDLKNILAEVLLELREEGHCLVKFERKQGCFHITATGQ